MAEVRAEFVFQVLAERAEKAAVRSLVKGVFKNMYSSRCSQFEIHAARINYPVVVHRRTGQDASSFIAGWT
jgi:hypothetical protein